MLEESKMLNVNPETVCYIIIKAREFDAKVEPVEPDPGSNPADGGEREILEDYPDDPTYQELMSALESLNQEEIEEVLALTWLGRGDFTKDEWRGALEEAKSAHDEKVVSYLTGIPLLGDYLEEGLSQLGHSCEEFEIGRL
jgi:hypothetical protein